MKQNFSKTVSRVAFYGCWVFIALVSLIYLENGSAGRPVYISENLMYPSIDPLIKTRHFSWRYTSNQIRRDVMAESRAAIELYSSVSNRVYHLIFYRPDFENYPVETSLILLFRLATYAGIVLFLFLLSKILMTVSREEPFAKDNHLRLFYMGFIMIVLPVIRTLHSTVMAAQVMYDPYLVFWDIWPNYDPLWLCFGGVVIIILSYVFKEGSRIHEEQQLTR